MVKGGLGKRIKCCGVKLDVLLQGVECGAYPNLNAALRRLESERPLGNRPREYVHMSRMQLVNNDIDRALFRMARATSAWTWLEIYNLVFVLMGPESRGMVLHENLRNPVTFQLKCHSHDGMRFLRFEGDSEVERVCNETESWKMTPLQILAGKLGMYIYELRDILETLVRTCDDSEWNHCKFPFVCVDRSLNSALKLLRRHRLMTYFPNGERPTM